MSLWKVNRWEVELEIYNHVRFLLRKKSFFFFFKKKVLPCKPVSAVYSLPPTLLKLTEFWSGALKQIFVNLSQQLKESAKAMNAGRFAEVTGVFPPARSPGALRPFPSATFEADPLVTTPDTVTPLTQTAAWEVRKHRELKAEGSSTNQRWFAEASPSNVQKSFCERVYVARRWLAFKTPGKAVAYRPWACRF